MGCNIPDIDIVVQWKLPGTVSSFVQRAGRAARSRDRKGLAVLLVEKSVYEADVERYLKDKMASPTSTISTKKPKKKKSVRQSTEYPKATKEYAADHGGLRGDYEGLNDDNYAKCELSLDWDSIDEGLYTLVQTGSCRRKVLTKIFGNKLADPSVPCCDICCPTLLDRTRPAPPLNTKRASAIKRGIPDAGVMKAVNDWRVLIFRRDFADRATFTASGFLSDNLLELLASVGPITSERRLKELLGASWFFYPKYNAELFLKLCSIDMPPMVPKPPKDKPASKKRAREEVTDGNGAGNNNGGGRNKRSRASNSQAVTREAPMPSSTSLASTPGSGSSSAQPPPPRPTMPHTPSTSQDIQATNQQEYPYIGLSHTHNLTSSPGHPIHPLQFKDGTQAIGRYTMLLPLLTT